MQFNSPFADNDRHRRTIAGSTLVMAEQSAHDVVNQARSVGDSSPSDVPALQSNKSNAFGDGENTTILTATSENLPKEANNRKAVESIVIPVVQGAESKDSATSYGGVSSNGLSIV